MDWLLKALASRVIWEIILLIGGGALFGFIKAKLPDWAPRVIYALAGATCIAILLFTFTGHAILARQPEQVTVENVEESVKSWTDSLGLGIARAPNAPSTTYFAYVVTLKNGTPLMVLRDKEVPDYLQFQTRIQLSQEHQAIFSRLTKEQTATVTAEVILELARSKIGNSVMQTLNNGQSVSQTENITVFKSVPIEGLTKDRFVNQVNELDSAVLLISAATELALERTGRVTSPLVRAH